LKRAADRSTPGLTAIASERSARPRDIDAAAEFTFTDIDILLPRRGAARIVTLSSEYGRLFD